MTCSTNSWCYQLGSNWVTFNLEMTKLTAIIAHVQRIAAIFSLLLSDESLANFNGKRAFMITFYYNLVNGQNSSRHISRAKAVAINPGYRTRPRAELTRVVLQELLIDN